MDNAATDNAATDTTALEAAAPQGEAAAVELAIGPDEAWRFLTEENLIGEWLGEGSRIDPTVGGSGLVDDVETGQRRRVHVTEVEPGRTLGFDWWPVDSGDAAEPCDVSHVTIDIAPSSDGCRITVVEEPAASAQLTGPSPRSGSSARSASACTRSWVWRLVALELRVALELQVLAGVIAVTR